jgi:adenylate cyclase
MAAKVKRKLAAILAADLVAYGRIRADERGMLARLKTLRHKFIDPIIADRRRRIVKLMDEGALVQFANLVDAVECVVTIERGMAVRAGGPSDTLSHPFPPKRSNCRTVRAPAPGRGRADEQDA